MKRLALIAAAIAIASPAMAQFVTTPYGSNGMMVTPYNGTTSGYTNSPPIQQPFVVPNTQFQQTQRPNLCAGFALSGSQLHC